LSPKVKKIGKILARSTNKYKCLANESLKNENIRQWVIIGIGKLLQYELKKICSDNANSILQSKDKEHISKLPWNEILAEIVKYCPTLFFLLTKCTTTSHSKFNQQHLVCTIVCMLCKFRRSNMSLLQRVVTTLLYSSHAGSMVCT
jgi:hypothetical protein